MSSPHSATAHGGAGAAAAPTSPIPDHILSVLPSDPRAQLDLGWKIISRAFHSRDSIKEHEIAAIQGKSAHVEFAAEEASRRLRDALEENARLLKERDDRSAILKRLMGFLAKDGGVANVEEFNKLLAEAAGLKMNDENNMYFMLAPTSEDVPKDVHVDYIPAKEKPTGSFRGTPSTSISSKEPESPHVQEDEIRSAISQRLSMTIQDIVNIFKPRLTTHKRKSDFADSLRKISKVERRDGQNWVVLREQHL